MCNERERLIEYVYGETGLDDRRRVDAHLVECHECRAEVTGLRAVRDDLLAWDVPKHDPIWRPFVPAPAAPTRRTWSTWALASAAGAVFAAGLAGGVGARGWLSEPGSEPSTTTAAALPAGQPPLQTVSSSVTPDDLARLEAAILTRVRTEMADQLRQTAAPAAAPGLTRVGTGAGRDDLEARVAFIEDLMGDQIRLNNIFNSKFGSLSSRTSVLSEQIELSSRLQRISLDGGAR